MNCHEFESTLNDIARETLTDAGRRELSEAHAARCRPCAARLCDARALTAGLRALSLDTADASPPPRVEARLLAAFRARAVEVAACESGATAVEVAPDRSATVVPLTVKKWSWLKTCGAAGLAAAAAVAFVLFIPPALFGPTTKTATERADTRQPEASNSIAPPSVPDSGPPDVVTGPTAQGGLITEVSTPPSIISNSRVKRSGMMRNAGYGATSGHTRPANTRAVAANANAEIVTDFIPLTDGSAFVAGEGAHLIRVELPRTALVRFGLPVNAERMGGRVKADVLLGEDGMARAIRFVR